MISSPLRMLLLAPLLCVLAGDSLEAAVLEAPPAPASGQTRYLLVGGGGSPFNTQVSLEEHLARVRRLLEDRGVPSERRPLLFTDGGSDAPVIEIYDRKDQRDRLLDDLALIMDRGDNRGTTWRPTQLTGVTGPATRARLKEQLEAPGQATRTVLYFAGHGHQDKGGEVTLGLWDQERLSPAQLTRWLDNLPRGHRFVAILSQCHSGGFGSLLYQGADLEKEPASADRCAFFAAPTDHPSSGCTPEANRPDPDDYSTWFFSAFAGALPNGKPLPIAPDLDGDGQVTLAEAHALARIHDGTLDVPVSSSEYFLRAETYNLPLPEGLTLSSPFAELLAAARPLERRVLETLAKSLGLDGDPAAALKARYEADRLEDERGRLREEIENLDDRLDEARATLRRALLNRWPWLGNPYHPRAGEVLEKDRAAIEAFISSRKERTEIDRLSREIRDHRGRIDPLDRRWARWERLARAAEIVVMERWLRTKGTPVQREKLDALLRCESDAL